MVRLIAVILAAALLAGCRSTADDTADAQLDKYAVGYIECPEPQADTVLVVTFTLRNTVADQDWPVPLKLIRLVDEHDNLVMVGGRFGSMNADGISPRTGKPMGFKASVGLAEPFGTRLDPNKPRSVDIRSAFTWTDIDGRPGALEKVYKVRIGQPDKHVLSDDVTITIRFREPVKK